MMLHRRADGDEESKTKRMKVDRLRADEVAVTLLTPSHRKSVSGVECEDLPIVAVAGLAGI